jgi:hypothetical protein
VRRGTRFPRGSQIRLYRSSRASLPVEKVLSDLNIWLGEPLRSAAREAYSKFSTYLFSRHALSFLSKVDVTGILIGAVTDVQAASTERPESYVGFRLPEFQVPKVLRTFGQEGNQYLVLEKARRAPPVIAAKRTAFKTFLASVRRGFSIYSGICFSELHSIGWVWRDCKAGAHFSVSWCNQIDRFRRRLSD